MKFQGNLSLRVFAAAALAVTMAAAPALSEAQGRGGHWHGGGYHGGYHGYHGYRGGGWGWGPVFGLALGVDLALASRPYYGSGYGYYGYPSTVVVQAPPPVVAYESRPAPAPISSAPEPVIYPRNGQSAAQTETDMRDCNAWATRQPRAMADGSVFQRATAACMDGRGYSIR